MVNKDINTNVDAMVDLYLPLVSRTAFRILCDRKDCEAVSWSVLNHLIDNPFPCDLSVSKIEMKLYHITVVYSIQRIIRRQFMWIFYNRPPVYTYSLAENRTSEDFIKGQVWEIYCRASRNMTPLQRVIYALMELEQLPVTDVAKITGLMPFLVTSALDNSREKVKKELRRYGRVL